MKFLIVLAACIAVALAASVAKPDENTYGFYKFTYSGPELSQTEVHNADGTVQGAYTYVDKENVEHEVKYVAGPFHGFEVVSHTTKGEIKPDGMNAALGVQLVDGMTPEVAAARKEHLAFDAVVRSMLPEQKEEEESDKKKKF